MKYEDRFIAYDPADRDDDFAPRRLRRCSYHCCDPSQCPDCMDAGGEGDGEDDEELTRRRRDKCKTDGNCSSFGSGRSCGAPDCDGY